MRQPFPCAGPSAARGTPPTHGGWAVNIGPTEAIMTGIRSRLSELAERHQRTVSIVGWSLGGTYARALARERPDLVRQVISLGSPYRMVEGDKTSATALWKRFEHLHDADVDLNRIAEQARPKLAVPATSVYSRRDGVAPWQTCIDESRPAGREHRGLQQSRIARGPPGGHLRGARPAPASRGPVAPVPSAVRAAAVVSTPGLVKANLAEARLSTSESPRPAWPGNAMMDMSPMRRRAPPMSGQQRPAWPGNA